jgi:hypothetical protein
MLKINSYYKFAMKLIAYLLVLFAAASTTLNNRAAIMRDSLLHSLKLPDGWDAPSQTLPGGVPPHVCWLLVKMFRCVVPNTRARCA